MRVSLVFSVFDLLHRVKFDVLYLCIIRGVDHSKACLTMNALKKSDHASLNPVLGTCSSNSRTLGDGPVLRRDRDRRRRIFEDRKAFTLLELLVIISIIIVLAALSFPVAVAVTSKAKEVKCGQQIALLSVAIEGYRAEYGHYPRKYIYGEYLTADNANSTVASGGRDHVGCLMGKVKTTGSFTNKRGISFFDPDISENKKGERGMLSVTCNFSVKQALV